MTSNKIMEKDTYKYHAKLGKKIIDKGITFDLIRRECDLQEKFPGVRLKQVGRRTTHIAALKWLRVGGKRGYKRHESSLGK